MKKPLFIAILEDESLFQGGNSYEHTRWLELPTDKKIKRLFYTLPDGNHLCLDIYDRYFMMIEALKDLNGRNAGKISLEYAYVLAEKDDKITCYKISLKYSGNEKIGDIQRIEYKNTDPFIQGLSKKGWR